MFTCMLGPYVASTVLLVPKPFSGHWLHQWTAAQTQRVPLQWWNHFWQSLEKGARKRGLECEQYHVHQMHYLDCSAKPGWTHQPRFYHSRWHTSRWHTSRKWYFQAQFVAETAMRCHVITARLQEMSTRSQECGGTWRHHNSHGKVSGRCVQSTQTYTNSNTDRI